MVVIQETPTLLKRHPELIGQRGTIVTHRIIKPDLSTWFNVHLTATDKTVKLREVSLMLDPLAAAPVPAPVAAVVASAPPSSPPEKEKSKPKRSSSSSSNNSSTAQTPATLASPVTAVVSSAGGMPVGSFVKILRTDNTSSRVPHLIHKIGIVHEAPGKTRESAN